MKNNSIDENVQKLFEKYKDLQDKQLQTDLASFHKNVKNDVKLQSNIFCLNEIFIGIESIFEEAWMSIGEQCKEQGELLNSIWKSYTKEYSILFHKKIQESISIIKLMDQEIEDIK